jgi:hypothetical protein
MSGHTRTGVANVWPYAHRGRKCLVIRAQGRLVIKNEEMYVMQIATVLARHFVLFE